MLASASEAREAEFLLGACALALIAPLPLLLFTGLSAHRIYIAQLLVAILAAVLGSLPWVRRMLTPRRAVRSACHRAALAQFVLRGIDRTRSGALVYVSLAEHYIRIVPAEEAARAVPQDQWQAAVDEALGPLAAGALEAALTGLAARAADLLSKPFPPGAFVGAAAAAALPRDLMEPARHFHPRIQAFQRVAASFPADWRRTCASVRAKFLQAEPKPDQAGPRKWAWIFLDSFVRIRGFSMSYGQSKQKMQLQDGVPSATRRRAAF